MATSSTTHITRQHNKPYSEYPIPTTIKGEPCFAWHPVKTIDAGWKWLTRVYWLQEEYLHITTSYVGVYNERNQLVRHRSEVVNARSYKSYYMTSAGALTKKLIGVGI